MNDLKESSINYLTSNLINKNNNIACECMKQLETLSENSDSAYRYFDTFADLLNSENSYIRTRGIILIGANAKWDKDYKIDEVIDKLLEHVVDVKPITARQCIRVLPKIALFKPELRTDILNALKCANPSRYNDSMQPLIVKDIADAIIKINIMN